MPDHPIDNAKKLQKLGQRLRDGFARECPIPDRSLETVHQTIRQEWEKERATKRTPTVPPPTRDRTKEGFEPEK